VAGLARLYYPSAYTYSYSGVYEFYKVAPSYREWEPKRFLLEITLVLGSVPRAPSPLISRSCWNTKSGIVNCSRGTYLKSSNNLSTYTTFFQTSGSTNNCSAIAVALRPRVGCNMYIACRLCLCFWPKICWRRFTQPKSGCLVRESKTLDQYFHQPNMLWKQTCM
jgi:hypothetical protein